MEIHEQAKTLLLPLWKGVPAAYKAKYARNIWQQFEDQVRSAAYTSSLSKFINTICSRLQITILKADAEIVNTVVQSGQDRALLRVLRDETTTAVLMVRVENEARRDEWERQRAEEQAALDAFMTEFNATSDTEMPLFTEVK